MSEFPTLSSAASHRLAEVYIGGLNVRITDRPYGVSPALYYLQEFFNAAFLRKQDLLYRVIEFFVLPEQR